MHITSVEKLTHERWVNLYAAQYKHNDHEGRWVFASRRDPPYQGLRNDAVLIAAVLRNPGSEPRLVMVREFRVPIGQYVIGLPAGLIDGTESIEEAIRRELHEETGFELTAVHRITQPLLSTAGLSDEAAALAFVDVKGEPGSLQHLEAGEDLEVLLLNHDEISRLCDDHSQLIDAKAWGVLFLYQQLGQLV